MGTTRVHFDRSMSVRSGSIASFEKTGILDTLKVKVLLRIEW